MVKRARNYTDDVEFSCEDAGRTPIADLARVVEAAINAGANNGFVCRDRHITNLAN
nr:hypothetical protein [Escherichia coli]